MTRLNADAMAPVQADSIADQTYQRIRSLVVGGELAPGARLGQGELADMLGVSRTPVREALRRLAGEGLVHFYANRGFYAADAGLEGVVRRLEVRAVLEPGAARLAASRRTEEDLQALANAVARERAARSATAAHDASRDFHMAVVGAVGNEEFTRIFDSLWIVEVGRRLLARRRSAPTWQRQDCDEHEAILAAIEAGDGDAAERLMRSHLGEALEHWSPEG